jgi:hypothetical protein
MLKFFRDIRSTANGMGGLVEQCAGIASRERSGCCMKLKQSNPYLKSAADWTATLRISAETSSAVEGIRAPFAKGRGTKAPAKARATSASMAA